MSIKTKNYDMNEEVELPADQQASSTSHRSLYSLGSHTELNIDQQLVYIGQCRPKDETDAERNDFEIRQQAMANCDAANIDKLEAATSTAKSNSICNQITAPKPPEGKYVFGIIDYNNSCGKICPTHHAELEAAFKTSLAQLASISPNAWADIESGNSEFVDDIYLVSVASVDCVDVLRDLVKNMPKWSDAKLRLASSLVLPTHSKANFCIRYHASQRSIEEILAILGRQNSGLNVDLWKIFCKVDFDDGVFIMAGIDPVSVLALRRSQGKMYYMTSIVEVNVECKAFGEYSFKDLKRNRSLALTVLQSTK